MVISMSEYNNVPKIRFKGFTDVWEQRKLNELLTQRVEHQTISSDAPLLAFSYAEGVINPEDKKTNKRDFIMIDKYNKVFSRTEMNDIIYNPANVIHGAIHRNRLGTGVVSPIYKIFKCNENVSPRYMGERLHTDKFISEIVKYIEGTVIKLRTLAPEKFVEMEIEIPKNIEEQELIGKTFEQIDNLITLHHRKYIKFFYSWEQRKLKEITSIITKGTTPLDKSETGDINFIKIENINPSSGIIESVSKITEEEHNGYLKRSQLKENDILFSIAGTLGRVSLINKGILPANTNQALAIIRLKEYDLNYIKTFLKGKAISDFIKKNPTIGAQPNLSLEQVSNFEISYPGDSEAHKIGVLLDSLDNLITLHQRKLEKLNNIKKSMLDKMFV